MCTWFRDYIYITLGGNRVGKIRHIANLMITFLTSGLWHGANWTFVVWGGVHGAAQAIENLIISKNKQKSTGIVWWIRVLFVFIFVSFAWIFFVSNSIGDAGYVITHWFCGISSPISYLKQGFRGIGLGKSKLLIIVFLISLLGIYDYVSLKYDCIEEISKKPVLIRYFVYLSLLVLILFLRASEQAEFVYFQF